MGQKKWGRRVHLSSVSTFALAKGARLCR